MCVYVLIRHVDKMPDVVWHLQGIRVLLCNLSKFIFICDPVDAFYRMGFLDRNIVVLSGVHWVWSDSLEYSEDSTGMVHASMLGVENGISKVM